MTNATIVECSTGAIKTAYDHKAGEPDEIGGYRIVYAYDMQIQGKRGPWRPKITWKTLTERDRREWKLNEVDPCDKVAWSLPWVQLASYLEGNPLMRMMLLHLHVKSKCCC